jgi:AcrR family transcriptional regulator
LRRAKSQIDRRCAVSGIDGNQNRFHCCLGFEWVVRGQQSTDDRTLLERDRGDRERCRSARIGVQMHLSARNHLAAAAQFDGFQTVATATLTAEALHGEEGVATVTATAEQYGRSAFAHLIEIRLQQVGCLQEELAIICLLTSKQMHPNVGRAQTASIYSLPASPRVPQPMSKPALHAQTANVSDSGTRRRRSHSERREEAEQRMIDAAVQIVSERGLDHLTLAECGEAAGYSRGLAAHYFGSRDGLISAIATHVVEDYAQRLRAGERRAGLDGLLASISFYIESGRSNIKVLRAFHAVLGAALRQTPLSAAIAELNRQSVRAFASTIRQGVQRGEIRADVDARAQAAIILATLRGVMTQWLLDPDHVDLDAISSELSRHLRRSLAP